MLDSPSLVHLTNGRLPDGQSVNIEIRDGLIAAITTVSDATAPATEHQVEDLTGWVEDLAGWLVLPAPAEPHAHLDKALTAELVPNPTGDLDGAISNWIVAADAGRITYDGMFERAQAALELLLVRGVTSVRSHVNVLDGSATEAVRAVRDAAAVFAGMLDVQIVGLCGIPLAGSAGAPTRAALAAALAEGLDAVGGCPHLEADGQGVIDIALDAATEAGIAVDLHVDEMLDPTVLTLKALAETVLTRGFEHPVTASHCVTLGMQPVAEQQAVARLVADAGIGIVALPQTNLFLQGRARPTATPRGITAVDVLREAGVRVAAGADNVQDPFNLMGRSDPLETASLMVMAAHQLPEAAYDLVSNDARRVIGVPPIALEPGSPADLLVIDAPSIRGAIAQASMSRRVYKGGRLVASSTESCHVHH